jgi:hypothetical protein
MCQLRLVQRDDHAHSSDTNAGNEPTGLEETNVLPPPKMSDLELSRGREVAHLASSLETTTQHKNSGGGGDSGATADHIAEVASKEGTTEGTGSEEGNHETAGRKVSVREVVGEELLTFRLRLD